MAESKNNWNNALKGLGRALFTAGLMSASIWGGRDLKRVVGIAGEAGVNQSVFDMLSPQENPGVDMLSQELEAKNDIIAAQNKQIDILKKQIGMLQNSVERLMGALQPGETTPQE